MKATPIRLDVSNNFRQVTLMVEDFTPFINLGVPVEITVSAVKETAPDPANIVQMPPAEKPEPIAVSNVKPFDERPASSSGPMGSDNAGNPNACPLCYGHGLVKEFRGENDITGTPAVCKTCGGTGINPEQAPKETPEGIPTPCAACNGSGVGESGKACESCGGTGISNT